MTAGCEDAQQVEFPTGGKVRDPRNAADLVTGKTAEAVWMEFQNRQYSLDERRTRNILSAQFPGSIPGDFLFAGIFFYTEIFQKGEDNYE